MFNRIMQQSLEYLNVPHDAEIKDDPKRQLMMANVRDSDLEEGGALDREGPGLDLAEAEAPAPTMTTATVPANAATTPGMHLIPGTALAATPVTAGGTLPEPSPSSLPAENPAGDNPMMMNVTIGPVVPSFLGKSVRGAIETAQQQGLEINVVGSGLAREQSPAPGSRIAAGERITVRFSR